MDGNVSGAAGDILLGLLTVGALTKGPAILKGILGSIANRALFKQLSAEEQAIILEVKALQSSGLIGELKAAYASGTEVSFFFNGIKITLQPSEAFSGLAFFGEDVFYMGREAFVSDAEIVKTLLHELYRLRTQSGIVAQGLGAGMSGPLTDLAFAFAEKTYVLFF